MIGAIFAYTSLMPSAPASDLTAQTVLTGEATPEQLAQAQLAQTLGKPAIFKVMAEDVGSSTRAKVVPPTYCWLNQDDTQLIADALAITTTGTSVSTVTSGDTVNCDAFNATVYSVGNSLKSDGNDLLVIPVKAVASSLDIKLLDQNNNLMTTSYKYNASAMGVNGVFSFDYIKIWANDTYASWNFKAIAIDVPQASNLTTIALANGDARGQFEAGKLAVQRLKGTSDYVFSLGSAVMMDYNDIFKTGALTLTADGDGMVGSGNAETVTLRFLDEQKFRSNVNSGSKAILSGVEDNAATPADVGANDFTMSFYATSDA